MRIRPVQTLGLAFVLALALWLGLQLRRPQDDSANPGATAEISRLAAQLHELELREQQIAETHWSKESLAQQCGRVFEELWDTLNQATNKLALLAAISFDSLQPGQRQSNSVSSHAITLFNPSDRGPEWTAVEWREFLDDLDKAGWQIGALEFRHIRFDVDADGDPGRSVFHCGAQLLNPMLDTRASVRGELGVEWGPSTSTDGAPTLRRLDASQLAIAVRSGTVPFEQVLFETIRPPAGSFFIDPLILHDLDGDGLSEVILAAANVVFRRNADGSYARSILCRDPPGLIFTAVMADFDGDGFSDLLCARHHGLHLYSGSGRGAFDAPGRPVWAANPRLKYAQVLTCGDADRDGDLDLWLGQYKAPYERGQMPTPYYDANDGYPAWFLLNDGHGRFTDATEAAELATKRFRRSYSGSLVDLDRDGDLDLFVVSDFAGIDLYLNDGRCRFTDMTAAWVPARHGFGMGHSFADFNRDGFLDVLVTGMHCPTALRLDHLGLARPGRPDYTGFRPLMTTGNQLWISRESAGFSLTHLNPSIAHSGWSWGSTSSDFDNDGWPDIYVANGHETRQSVREYEPEFWLHDIYVADSDEDVLMTAYFGTKIARTRGRGWSYGGYEMNRLFLNLQGKEFIEAGHLLGVGLSQDCRVTTSDDLDGDGRMDLLTTTFEVWPKAQQTLRIFRNNLEPKGNWIGFRFRGGPGGPSPIGTTVHVQTSTHRMIQQIVTGDSHRTQHSWTVHFGLGSAEEVQSATVIWPNRTPQELSRPAINQYHVAEIRQQPDWHSNP